MAEENMNIKTSDILELSVAERIQMVEDIWDSIAGVPDSVLLSEGQKKELDRRLEAYHSNPDAGAPWIEVRERIRNWSGK
jgi:putative addiction module component (TIGR02574 family)